MLVKDLFAYNLNDGGTIGFRLLSSDDSIVELTQLLNKSYKFLADMGLNYIAATQDNNITLDRISKANKCYVGIYKDRIVATISLYSPSYSDKSSWYSKDFVAKVGQFAVLPELQKLGIGSKMMDIVEVEAKGIRNVKEIALDTAETAYHLINFYEKRGYKYIETVNWGVVNYHSVILSKAL